MHLSNQELLDIHGGRSLMITPYYGFVKIMKYLTKLIKSKSRF